MASIETLIRQIMDTLPTLFALSYTGTGWSAQATYGVGENASTLSATGDYPAEAVYNLTVSVGLGIPAAVEA